MADISYIRGSSPKASITFGNTVCKEDAKGLIAIPTEFVPVAVSHGFTVVPDPYIVHKTTEAEKKDSLIYLV